MCICNWEISRSSMVVILEGELQARGDINGETFVIPFAAGDVTGVLPFSRMKKSVVTGRALTESRILKFPSSHFPELIQKMPELTQRLVGVMADRIREVTRVEQQRDRLAGLGKLSAGLAHELNNPASAAKRATSLLRDALKRIKDAVQELGKHDLTAAQKSEIEKLEASFLQPNRESARHAGHERPGGPDRFLAAQSRAKRFVATGFRSGAPGGEAGSAGVAVRNPGRGRRPGRAGPHRGLG